MAIEYYQPYRQSDDIMKILGYFHNLICITSAILSGNYNWIQQYLESLMRKRWKERKFLNRMLMTLSDQIASFSVEVSDENISGCKSCILCRFCLLCFANILWWWHKTRIFPIDGTPASISTISQTGDKITSQNYV